MIRKLTWSFFILIIAIWAAILVYWIGTEKNQSPTVENPESSITLSPISVPLATDSANIAPFESSSPGIILTSPTITVKY